MRLLRSARGHAELALTVGLGLLGAVGVTLGSASFVARDGAIQVVRDGETTPLFLHAVNLGVGVPGTQPGELAPTRDQYDRWLARMGSIGFNAVRIYTLHYPRFYEALRDYNLNHPDQPLYLLHGIWLDEENPDPAMPDLHHLTSIFQQGIMEGVGAVYGDIEIDHRWGRAYGRYEADVSPWVMGWIIGREIYPDEVEVTNIRHPAKTSYHGTHLSLSVGTPTEIWLVEQLDFLARYEEDQYGGARPSSVSSWPTLDPLTHISEHSESSEDSHWIDLAQLDLTRFPPGYFASYHAYPYYPDFMSEDPHYVLFHDAEGPNSYLGYLTALRDHYYPVPVVIAEFGVPSSWGNAHNAHSGMHHGGHDEVAQGHYAVRMFQNIAEAGCAGGVLFAWIDEWWKNTWITEYLDFPLQRRPHWLNITAPEQNYGLIAFEEPPPAFQPVPHSGPAGSIQELSWAATHVFFHLDIRTDTRQWPLVIGFDTYGEDLGETVLPGGIATTVRNEFALVIEPGTAQLYVTRAYDLFGMWHDRWNYVQNEHQLYRSIPTDGAPWVPVRWLSNRAHGNDDGSFWFPETIDEIGRLQVSVSSDFVSSRDAIAIGDHLVRVRIPWTLLQFTDPSQHVVLHDDRATPQRETALSDGIRLVVVQQDSRLITERLIWDRWDFAPQTIEREKPSLWIVERFLQTIGTPHELDLYVVERTPDSITLDWTGGGVLVTANSLSGPWSETEHTAPVTLRMDPKDDRFFRVQR